MINRNVEISTNIQVCVKLNATGGAIALTSERGIVATPGGLQADAYQLSKDYSRIDEVASEGDGVKCFAAKKNKLMEIGNCAQNAVNIYPKEGKNFYGMTTDAPILLSPGNRLSLFCFDDDTWTQ